MSRPNASLRATRLLCLLALLSVAATGCTEPSGAVDEQTARSEEAARDVDDRSLATPGASERADGDTERGDDDVWMTIRIGDKRVGYARSSSRKVERDGRTLIQREEHSQITFHRFGQTLSMQSDVRSIETPDGDLIELWSTTRNPPAEPSRTHAVVEGNELRLEVETGGRTSRQNIPWKPGTKSPSYDWDFDDNPLEKGRSRTENVFLPDFNRIATTTVTGAGKERLPGSEGTVRKYTMTSDVVPGTTTLFVDADGNAILTRSNIVGVPMETKIVDRATAIEQIEGSELDLAIETLIKVEPIPNAHRTKRAVYRIRAAGDDPGRFLAEGRTQSVRRIDDETVELTVVAAAFPEKPSDATAAREYSAASPFLQSEDARVVAHAKQAAGDATEPADVARKLEAYVRDAIKTKNFSTAMASAAEVAERLEGDCTEHAVLLAAMLRARGIPSRIAVGFVYSTRDAAFAGHMWTEAFVDGAWVPLDGILGRGGTAAAHIKLADSAFADETGHPIAAFLPVLESIGKLQIEVVESE